MKKFLEKIRLIDQLTIEIEGIHKNEFVDKLKREVDHSDLGLFSDLADVFASSKNEFKGQVSYEGFKIRRKKRFFDMNMNMSTATGHFVQRDEKLIINSEIDGFRKIFIPVLLMILLIYVLMFITLIMAPSNDSMLAIPFMLFHASLMMGIPYLLMRRSTSRMKRELEREFYFIAKR